MASRNLKRRSSGTFSRKITSQITKHLTAVLPNIMTQMHQNIMANVNPPPPPPPSAPVVTYKNFTDAKPTKFNGTQGATTLLQWYEKMESVFYQIECPDDKQTRFTTGMFEEGALTWWVKEKTNRGTEAAMAFPWNELKDLMTQQFFPPNELMNLEAKFWNLKQEGGEHSAYTSCFNKLSVLVPHLVTTTSPAIEKYIRGLPRQIQDSFFSSLPKELGDAINLAATLTDNHVKAGTEIIPETGR
ncbi:uncharacterized protein LOC143593549 [Bidens hawaiensis]|uniref:uncharacterized protein LOC143593549 n=1 Tax=Bidens hawaiensis TaxID=980011 RepID=UPI00404A897E